MEFLPDSPEKRAWQEEGLRRIAQLAMVEISPPVAEEFAVFGQELSPIPAQPGNPYSRLADRLFEEFLSRTKGSGDNELIRLADNMSVSFGAGVVCAMISYAPTAYAAYAYENGKAVDMAEFEESLRASSRAAALFATTDRRRATTLEVDFGIAPYSAPTYEVNPFRFERNLSGALRFTHSGISRVNSLREIASREDMGDLKPVGAHRKCPAYWEVVDSMWQRAVTIALEGPSLFQRNFTLAQARLKQGSTIA